VISAVVMPEPDAPLELRTFARPKLEPGAVPLKTLASEVCGTDVHLWKGQLAGVPYPIIPGHVSVGQIAAIGPAHTPADVPKSVRRRAPVSSGSGDGTLPAAVPVDGAHQ
jgi:D-arabinose 1-dehydrogenase-like Zn-dependent alcohol dehydrogenase